MARTPLFARVRQLAAKHETPAPEPEFGRRTALRLIGASAVTLGGCRPPFSAAPDSVRIGIVGAGIAGLSAALALFDAGLSAVVYEASSDVGGRMRSDTESWGDGQVTEWCGELIDTQHRAVAALARRFRLSLDDVRASEVEATSSAYMLLGKTYSPSQADRDFGALAPVLAEHNALAPFPTTYEKSTAAGRALDAMSVHEWIGRYVQGGHASPLGALLDVAYTAEYGRDTREQSSLNLVYLLAGSSTTFSPFGNSDERFRVHGGNQRLPRAIAAHLPPRSVRNHHRLTQVGVASDGTVVLGFVTPGGVMAFVNVDSALLTLPFSVLRDVDCSAAGFDNRKRTAIAELGYGTNAKLQVQFVERFWQESGRAWPASNGTSFSDSGYQSTWESTRGQAGKSGVLVNYTGGSTGRRLGRDSPYAAAPSLHVESASAEFRSAFATVFPGTESLGTGRATLSTPTLDPNLRGSYACWLVGQYTRFAGYEGAPQGPIHFAGEHCSLEYQGFMEGAVLEGQRAAREIIARYTRG